MINYSIPGLWAHRHLNFKLFQLMQSKKEYFYPDINIEAVYGTYPWCVFDGGRIFNHMEHISREDVNETTKRYNDLGIPIRLVYTNSQIEDKHLHNRFDNIVLKDCENGFNQIVVANNKLLEYIKTYYPRYVFISSTTKCLNQEDFIKELEKEDFAEVCLDYNLNTNLELLKSLNKEQRKKCEFLCNAICPPGCPTRKHHYKLNSLHQLQFGRSYAVPHCSINGNNVFLKTRNYKNNLSYDTILNTYIPMGFQHFKLEGRTLPTEVQALIYAEYMIKPEYKDEFISILLSRTI